MPQILVNFKHNKKTNKFEILDSQYVFVDLPIAMMEMGRDYDEILIVPINGNNVVVEKEEYLAENKLFNFKIIENKVEETTEKPDFSMYLPKDTDVSLLRFINGQLLKIEPEEQEQKEGEQK